MPVRRTSSARRFCWRSGSVLPIVTGRTAPQPRGVSRRTSSLYEPLCHHVGSTSRQGVRRGFPGSGKRLYKQLQRRIPLELAGNLFERGLGTGDQGCSIWLEADSASSERERGGGETTSPFELSYGRCRDAR